MVPRAPMPVAEARTNNPAQALRAHRQFGLNNSMNHLMHIPPKTGLPPLAWRPRL
jgi:hypothetical protein